MWHKLHSKTIIWFWKLLGCPESSVGGNLDGSCWFLQLIFEVLVSFCRARLRTHFEYKLVYTCLEWRYQKRSSETCYFFNSNWAKMQRLPPIRSIAQRDEGQFVAVCLPSFPILKALFEQKQFRDIDHLRRGLTGWFASKDQEFYERGIDLLPERWQKCVDSNGEYFE